MEIWNVNALFEPVNDIEVGQDAADRISIGFSVGAESNNRDALHSRQIRGSNFFPRLPSPGRDIHASNLNGNGCGSYPQAFAVGEEPHDPFVGIQDEV